MRRGRPLVGIAALALAGVWANRAAENGGSAERLAHHRNLGKAFYENPTTQLQAVDEFKKALDLAPASAREQLNYGLALLRAGKTAEGVEQLEKAQKTDPAIPHTWFNLGIVFKKESQYDKAIRQLEQMAKLVPDEATTHYNLGVLYKLNARPADALREFELSAKLNGNLAGPRFQLFNAYKLAGRTEDAAREEKIFYALKKQKTGAAVPEDLDWSFYAEVMDPADAALAADERPSAEIRLTPKTLGKGFTGMASADLDADGKPDLLAWGAAGLAIVQGPKLAGLPESKDILAVAPADFNNDGLVDLCVVGTSGVQLLANRKDRFEAQANVTLPAGAYRALVWMDFDHDYDLDLFLLGAKSVLMRNNGAAGFSDETASFPFVKGAATAAVLFDLIPDTDGFDMVVTYEDRPGVLYRDLLGGNYQAVDIAAIPAGTRNLAARDLNNDGATDLVAGGRMVLNQAGRLTASGNVNDVPVALVDLDNRGLADLVLGGAVVRNLGAGRTAKTEAKPAAARALVSGDFDADGREDIAAVTDAGEAQIWTNESAAAGSAWLRARLTGVKNMKLAVGSKVEVKAGRLYQKQTYAGLPLHFGLRGAADADTVRVTWANGLVQNEIRKPAGKELPVKEAPRLSGSCPMIFTWNGRQFQFISDVLAVAPLGASAGDGRYFPVDHDEYVQLPLGALVEREGRFDVRITEELREVSYLDQVELVAVDHPAGEELYTNDKFKSPPFPDFRLFGVRKRIAPIAARDHRGADVLAKVLRRDAAYADTFTRTATGTAEPHSIELDFGNAAPGNRAILVLNGWVDWADGSTFRAASQERASGLAMPELQVLDAQGKWRTVVPDMGIPAGKPKSIVVDLTGKFLSASRRVRIVTGLCVYWDEIFLSEDTAPARSLITRLQPRAAQLAYRGFSQVVVHPERKQPERFVYDSVMDATSWSPTPGLYTRFGPVDPLLRRIDDQMVIMGSGDELALQFDATRLPVLRSGWTREFLLLVDGWAKDGDANTAFARTVEPLPFHGMSQYPYGARERFPGDPIHEQYRKTYNTRPALRLLTSLRPKLRTE